MASKNVLRQVYLEKRLTLTQAEYQRRNILLQENILRNVDFSGVDVAHIFLSITRQKEVDTFSIIEKIRTLHPETAIAVSKTLPERRLEHFLLAEDSKLITSSWGIPEPSTGEKVAVNDIDLIFVPLISFDKSGHRIGYGGGYYDTFLQEVHAARKIGLSLGPALDKIDYIEEFDIQLDGCITPFEVFNF